MSNTLKSPDDTAAVALAFLYHVQVVKWVEGREDKSATAFEETFLKPRGLTREDPRSMAYWRFYKLESEK